MKKYIIAALLTASLSGMQLQLRKAIAKSDLPKVEFLLSKLKSGSPQESTYLLGTHTIDLDQLQSYAQDCAEYAESLRNSRNNVHVYKGVVLGISTFTAGLVNAGYYFYQSTTSGQPGSYTDFLTMLAASGALMGHGVENIRTALGNHEAHNLYAKYVAIKELINKARHESVLDTSL